MSRSGPTGPTESPRWQGLVALLVVFAGSLLVAAFVAPYALRAARALAETFPGRLTLYLADKELPRYFDRFRWLAVLAGLPWLIRSCGIRSVADLGLAGLRARRRAVLGWFGVGVATVVLLAAAQLGVGNAAWRPWPTWPRAVETILLSLLSAAVIGVVEEILFRGVVLRAFLRALPSTLFAVLLAAGFFAITHFQKVPSRGWSGSAEPTIREGLDIALRSLWPAPGVWRSDLFLGLLLAGLALCLLVVRERGLWPAVALHAGWVWSALVYRRLFAVPAADASRAWLWGSRDLVDGLTAWLLLSGIAAGIAARILSQGGGAPGAVPAPRARSPRSRAREGEAEPSSRIR